MNPAAVWVGPLKLPGDLVVPPEARALVIFAHGSGSSRLSPRNQFVSGRLHERGLATLLFDLLTDDEVVQLMRQAPLAESTTPS